VISHIPEVIITGSHPTGYVWKVQDRIKYTIIYWNASEPERSRTNVSYKVFDVIHIPIQYEQ
jgi:hypothetical protein